MIRLAAVVLLVAALAGCNDPEETRSTDEVVADVEEVASVRETVRLTADSDPNDLLGRAEGYDAAVVFVDATTGRCATPGIECGAFLERWETSEDASERSGYLLALQRDMPMFGTEEHHLDGPFLLRLSGELDEETRAQYAAAFSDDG